MIAPTLYTDRLTLRSFEDQDAHDYAKHIFKDPLVMRYMNILGRPPEYPLLHATGAIRRRLHEWEQRPFGAWALTLTDGKLLMGHVGLYVIEGTQTVEIGYALGQAYWGRGYATEAARAVLHYGFTVANLDEIVAVAVPQNVASLNVMRKLGMEWQGLVDDYYQTTLACYKLSRGAYLARTDDDT